MSVSPIAGLGTPVVSVIIVNFNAGPYLARCIEAVTKSTVPLEVLVVDNASKDGSLEEAAVAGGAGHRVATYPNGENLGFAKAVNIGIEASSAPYVLLLNPDCEVEPDSIKVTLDALIAHGTAGAAGCVLRNCDGSEQAGGRRSIPTPWRTFVRVLHLDRLAPNRRSFRSFDHLRMPLPEHVQSVEAISGAFMLIPRSVLNIVGSFDEGYFLHCEDLDWCMRCIGSGHEILFVPGASVLHHKGVCSREFPIAVELHKHRGMLRFYRKFFRHQYPGVLMWAVSASIWARFFAKAMVLWVRRDRGERIGMRPKA